MCVVSVAWRAHPRWRLVVAGNRDEFHAREAAPLSQWGDDPAIIAGRDISSQGTWMGVSNTGRFGVVTNIRNPQGPDPQKASRGALVTNWLARGDLPKTMDVFNPFNLLIGDQEGLYFLSNRPSDSQNPLGEGIHGLSNAIQGERWPRTERLNLALKTWLGSEADNPATLFECLADSHVTLAAEHPIFIQNPIYGTRCSTILTVDDSGVGQIIERRFGPTGASTGESAVTFRWPA